MELTDDDLSEFLAFFIWNCNRVELTDDGLHDSLSFSVYVEL